MGKINSKVTESHKKQFASRQTRSLPPKPSLQIFIGILTEQYPYNSLVTTININKANIKILKNLNFDYENV